MELSFVIASLRKWWWVAILCAVGGGLAAMAIVGPRQRLFESRSVVAINASTAAPASPDRFVAQQIAVIRSQAFLDGVARRISVDPKGLASEVKVSQQPATDLVRIVATAADGERARAIAGAVADEYISYERQRERDRRQQALDALDERAKAIEGDIRRLTPAPGDPNAAEATAQRTRKEQEYREVLATKSELVANSGEAVSVFVERATAARPVADTRRTLIPVAGVLFGAAVGLALATAFARFSRFLVSDAQASEILAAPLVARIKIPAAQAYTANRLPPKGWRSDQAAMKVVAAHIQSMVDLGAPLRIAVVAAQRGAGATSLSLALAGTLWRAGERVVLVDADHRNPELSATCWDDGRGARRLPASAGESAASRPSLGSKDGTNPPVVLTAGNLGLRRDAVPALLARAGTSGDLVVVDGGPLLDSAPARQLCQSADAVVFVLSSRWQRIDVLHMASLPLREVRDKLLVLSVSLQRPRGRALQPAARRRRHRKHERPVASAAGLRASG